MSDTIWAKLAAPLDPATIKTRPQAGKQLRYIDSRTVSDRLDSVVAGDWTLKLDLLPSRVNGNGEEDEACAFMATLTVNGVSRSDVGVGKHYKDAASDAFKRAAVRFGIGRELYDPPKESLTRPQVEKALDMAPAAAAPKAAKPNASDVPACPKCGGKMFDNRVGKKNPKAPDFRCRDKDNCDGVVWPPREKVAAAPAPVTQRPLEEVFDTADDLPF